MVLSTSNRRIYVMIAHGYSSKSVNIGAFYQNPAQCSIVSAFIFMYSIKLVIIHCPVDTGLEPRPGGFRCGLSEYIKLIDVKERQSLLSFESPRLFHNLLSSINFLYLNITGCVVFRSLCCPHCTRML